MPRIVEEEYYNGVREKITRLGLGQIVDEVRGLVTGFDLRLLERTHANGGAALREILDERFASANGWSKAVVGDIDWRKCHSVNGTSVCVGVEVQVSARSDLLVMDIIHLRRVLSEGVIDVGILVVPSDRLSTFLPSRAPFISDAKKHDEGRRPRTLATPPMTSPESSLAIVPGRRVRVSRSW